MRSRAALLLAAAALACGQTAGAVDGRPGPVAQRRIDAKLKDRNGATLGQVERIITDAQGKPVQIEVRVTRVLRTLPIDALTRSGADYVTVLSRAELEALPASN